MGEESYWDVRAAQASAYKREETPGPELYASILYNWHCAHVLVGEKQGDELKIISQDMLYVVPQGDGVYWLSPVVDYLHPYLGNIVEIYIDVTGDKFKTMTSALKESGLEPYIHTNRISKEKGMLGVYIDSPYNYHLKQTLRSLINNKKIHYDLYSRFGLRFLYDLENCIVTKGSGDYLNFKAPDGANIDVLDCTSLLCMCMDDQKSE